jgi:hypothetical protein
MILVTGFDILQTSISAYPECLDGITHGSQLVLVRQCLIVLVHYSVHLLGRFGVVSDGLVMSLWKVL